MRSPGTECFFFFLLLTCILKHFDQLANSITECLTIPLQNTCLSIRFQKKVYLSISTSKFSKYAKRYT